MPENDNVAVLPIENAPAPVPGDWRTFMDADLKADPVVTKWAEKASEKDIKGLIKGYAHTFTRQGNAIHLPGKDAKPEEMTVLKAKLVEAGVMPKPITDPKEYAIAKPENLPAGVTWSDELSGKLATTLQKYQVPKEAVADLMALHIESLGGAVGSFAGDHNAVMAELKTEHGAKFDERKEMAERLIPEIFKTDAEAALASRLGLGDNARFVSILMRLAPYAMQDSSFVEKLGSQSGGSASGEAARNEVSAIMSDPKHPMYAGYKRNDQAVKDHIAALYSKAYPGTVELG